MMSLSLRVQIDGRINHTGGLKRSPAAAAFDAAAAVQIMFGADARKTQGQRGGVGSEDHLCLIESDQGRHHHHGPAGLETENFLALVEVGAAAISIAIVGGCSQCQHERVRWRIERGRTGSCCVWETLSGWPVRLSSRTQQALQRKTE